MNSPPSLLFLGVLCALQPWVSVLFFLLLQAAAFMSSCLLLLLPSLWALFCRIIHL